ncbi:hypothetical protein CA13_39740 [Planctomycetes bacterium CA13]|uniref:Uncharacterized protein n=1 Tax=Novipirellula herctigrandis TaxID=2527986 RepID=A0A5C5Z6S4_9BACT|nr:hypothetical protein CA13_39740 [Planctomycetes bacterium CA13]
MRAILQNVSIIPIIGIDRIREASSTVIALLTTNPKKGELPNNGSPPQKKRYQIVVDRYGVSTPLRLHRPARYVQAILAWVILPSNRVESGLPTHPAPLVVPSRSQ